MRKILPLLTIFTFVMSSQYATAQDLPRIEHDTLFTKSGYNVTEYTLVRLGTGSNPVDGSFVYVMRNQDGPYDDHRNILPASWKDVRMHVYRLTRRGNKSKGYTYIVLLLAHSGPKIQVDMDKAIQAGEIIVPDSVKPASNLKTDK